MDVIIGKEKRKILLLVDNCSSHLVEIRLENIKLEFFPTNFNSVVQPLDQGIIKNAKENFRHRIIEKILIENRDLLTSINVRQVMEMITNA